MTSKKFALGDRVFIKERRFVVSEKEMKLTGGEVQFRYLLTGESFNTVPRQDNQDFMGMSFQGEVISTKGEEVVAALDIDKEGSPQNKSFCSEFVNGMDLHPGSMGVLATAVLEGQAGVYTGVMHGLKEVTDLLRQLVKKLLTGFYQEVMENY